MGGALDAGEKFVRWIELRPTNAGIQVWNYVVPDLGDECLDLYAQASVELEPLAIAPDATRALALAHLELGADPDRWVNQGVSQDEFLDFLRAERPIQWPPAGA